MSRAFSVSLMLVGTAVLTALVSWHFYALNRAHADLIDLTLTVQERGNAALAANVQEFAHYLHWEIDNKDGDYYRPLLPVLEALQEAVRNYPETIETVVLAGELLDTTTVMLAQLRATLADTIEEHADAFDLNDWMLEERLEALKTLGKDNIFVAVNYPPEEPATTTFPWFRALVYEHFLLECRELIKVANLLVSRPCFIFDADFPIFLEPLGTVARGEKVTAHLAVGTYRTSHAPENIRFLIDGKEYGVGYDGILNYDFVPKERGEHSLEVKLRTTNPLTGEVRHAESTHYYRVE